jgi:GNAT superfamily N-acetyltransferase
MSRVCRLTSASRTWPPAKVTKVTTLEIAVLPAAVADDVALTSELAELINDVYAIAEKGMWVDGATRTTVERVAELVRTGQIAVARVAAQIVGCVRIQFLGDGVGEFGMLAVIPSSRGTGVGRDLVRFAEQAAQRERCHTMQLEVLVPRGWSHPSKEFLTDWYTRSGYNLARVGAIEESYPELAPLLSTSCDYMIYRKTL